MPQENPSRKYVVIAALVFFAVVVFLTLQSNNQSTGSGSSGGRVVPTPLWTMQPKPTIDSSIFQSDTRYGDYYYIRRTNVEVLVNCKTGRVITRDRITKEEADATAMAKSMGVDWSTVCR